MGTQQRHKFADIGSNNIAEMTKHHRRWRNSIGWRFWIASFKGAHFKCVAGKNAFGNCQIRLTPVWVYIGCIFTLANIKLGNRAR